MPADCGDEMRGNVIGQRQSPVVGFLTTALLLDPTNDSPATAANP
jgi:hypothetical protein